MAKKAERKKSALPFDKRIAVFLLLTVLTVLISFFWVHALSPRAISRQVYLKALGSAFLPITLRSNRGVARIFLFFWCPQFVHLKVASFLCLAGPEVFPELLVCVLPCSAPSGRKIGGSKPILPALPGISLFFLGL